MAEVQRTCKTSTIHGNSIWTIVPTKIVPRLGLGLVLWLVECQFFSGTIALEPEETTIKRILMNAFFNYQFNYCPFV